LVAGKGVLFPDCGGVALHAFEDPARLYEVRWREEMLGGSSPWGPMRWPLSGAASLAFSTSPCQETRQQTLSDAPMHRGHAALSTSDAAD
jgi:hypothetical protein